jgi:DNA-binding MarR family transcriptional regulator
MKIANMPKKLNALSPVVREDRIDKLMREWQRERPELDVSPMAVVGRILNLGDILKTRATQSLKGLAINYTDLDVLATLRRAGSPYQLTPTVLRQSVLLTSGAMTACLNRLEKAQFVKRYLEDSDRRSLTAALTVKGRVLIDRAIVVRFAEANRAISNLSASERTSLANLLRKLGTGLS